MVVVAGLRLGLLTIVIMIVIMRGRRCVAGRQGIAGRRRFGPAFAFLAEELAIAQAQDALVHADRIGTLHEFLCRQLATLFDQGFSVDDDLALAAEIRGQSLLDHALHVGALDLRGAG